MESALTPKEKKKQLRKRLNKVVPHLEKKTWVAVFVTFFPEYADQTRLLSNVRAGVSLDEAVITKMEELVEKIKELKNNAKK
jgi:hypothetical protein